MSNPDKIDFTALDPSVDREPWEARIARVTRLGLARRAVSSVPLQLVTWARPALAMAAALALLVWTGFLFHDPHAQTSTATDPASLLSHWAINNEIPSSAEVLTILGGDHDAR